MQRLARLPATPNLTLLDRGKPKPYPWSHANTTFTQQIYIRWCCFDLSNAPDLSGLAAWSNDKIRVQPILTSPISSVPFKGPDWSARDFVLWGVAHEQYYARDSE